MAGKPKDESKEYSPEWGGKNRGGGKKPDGLIHRPVAMTFLDKEEYRRFMDSTTTRSRVEIVLKEVMKNDKRSDILPINNEPVSN